MDKSKPNHAFANQATEVGSIAALESYHTQRDVTGSRTFAKGRAAASGTPLSTLRNHEYLICISDRIHQTEQFPFEGCDDIVDEILEGISKGDSVLVIGEPGIGKRTLSLGLARKFESLRRNTSTPLPLYDRVVYALSLGSSFWSRPPGEDVADIQDNIREVFRLVEAVGPEKIVLCIDDIDLLGFVDGLVREQSRNESHMLSEFSREEGVRDSPASVENMLRSLLFNKKVLCLCTCIKGAYERLIQLDTYYDEKFTKAFRVLHMSEPDEVQSLQIARAHQRRLELETGVRILDEAVRAAVAYAIRHMPHRAMPDKALDLLHEACRLAWRLGESEASVGELSAQQDNQNSRTGDRSHGGSGKIRMVGKKHVDDLMTAWCGLSKDQLSKCSSDS